MTTITITQRSQIAVIEIPPLIPLRPRIKVVTPTPLPTVLPTPTHSFPHTPSGLLYHQVSKVCPADEPERFALLQQGLQGFRQVQRFKAQDRVLVRPNKKAFVRKLLLLRGGGRFDEIEKGSQLNGDGKRMNEYRMIDEWTRRDQ